MLKKILSFSLLFIISSGAHGSLYVTIKDLRQALKNPQFGRTMELQREMHSLNNDYKGVPMQREYLIDRYHRLTEELSILKAKLKNADEEEAERNELVSAIIKKHKEILSLKKSYQKECGTTDIEEHAQPVLEALDKLQNTPSYALIKEAMVQNYAAPLPAQK